MAQKIRFILPMLILTIIFMAFVNSEIAKDKKDPKTIDLKKDLALAGKSVVKKSKASAIAKMSLHFKSMSANYDLVGSSNDRATVKTYAILEGVSEKIMQEIADEFYKSFSIKLKNIGIAPTEWKLIASAEDFAKMNDKQIDKFWESKTAGYADVVTANQGPHAKQIVGNPGIWKTYADIGKELEANVVTLDVVIDFANFLTQASKSRGYATTTLEASAQVEPLVKIIANSGSATYNNIQTQFAMIGKYGEATTISLTRNIPFEGGFAVEVKSYSGKVPEKMQRRISFGESLTTGTFIINADEQKYKAAVLSALDKYSNSLIEIMKEVRK